MRFASGANLEEIQQICAYDPWFLREIEAIVEVEKALSTQGLARGRG